MRTTMILLVLVMALLVGCATNNPYFNWMPGIEKDYTASIAIDHNIIAGYDAMTLTEQSATVDVGGSVTVSATTDALTLTEQAATITVDHNILATVDTLDLVAHSASISVGGVNTDYRRALIRQL